MALIITDEPITPGDKYDIVVSHENVPSEGAVSRAAEVYIQNTLVDQFIGKVVSHQIVEEKGSEEPYTGSGYVRFTKY